MLELGSTVEGKGAEHVGGELADCNFRGKNQVSWRGCYVSEAVKEVLGG